MRFPLVAALRARAARQGELAGSAERVVFFTDAIVAIALTLLALPLADVVPEAVREHRSLGELVDQELPAFGSFLLSFAVIYRFWWAHHRLFRHVSQLSLRLVGWNVAWSLAIVFLPVPTAVITAYTPSAGTVGLYCGTLVLLSGSLTMMARTAYLDPRLSADRRPESRHEVLGNASAFVLQLAALVIGTVFASTINFFALSLMFLSGPLEALVKRWWARRETRATP